LCSEANADAADHLAVNADIGKVTRSPY